MVDKNYIAKMERQMRDVGRETSDDLGEDGGTKEREGRQ